MASAADQIISSLQSFALLIAALQHLDLQELGIFSLTYAMMTLALTVSRSRNLEPLVVLRRDRSTEPGEELRDDSAAVGTSLLHGTALAVACAVGALVLREPLLLACGVAFPWILAQDAYRYIHFAERRQSLAAVQDGVALVATLALIALLYATDAVSATSLIAAWGVGALFGMVAGFAQTRALPEFRGLTGWTKRSGELGRGNALSTMIQQGVGRLSQVLISVIASPAALGAITASRTVFMPANTALTASMSFALPEGVSTHGRRGTSGLSKFIAAVSIVLSIGVTLLILALLLLPDSIGRLISEDNWPTIRSLTIPTGLWVLGMALSQGPKVGLRVLGAGALLMRVSTTTGLLLLTSTALGAYFGDARGAAWGFGLTSIACNLLWWKAYSDRARGGTPPLSTGTGEPEGTA
ncbi:hypothetical protein ACH0CA_02840 [Kytococcus sedentarius]|uniref:hypothetical protein n=1 Tax=Kytococcus sedentarius TaxID=1276 RepID=UPI00387A68D6